jgi:DNA primase
MNNLTIADVLSYYGADLSKAEEYKWSKIQCPFHDDKVASASVYLEQGTFSCHGCDVHGDVLNTIARAEGFGSIEHPDRKAANEWANRTLGKGYTHIPRTANEPARGSTWRDRLFA